MTKDEKLRYHIPKMVGAINNWLYDVTGQKFIFGPERTASLALTLAGEHHQSEFYVGCYPIDKLVLTYVSDDLGQDIPSTLPVYPLQ